MLGHTGEIVSLHFNAEGDKILTGSFDRTAMVRYNQQQKNDLYILFSKQKNL